MFKKPELLVPAGSLISLKTALYYGADAVFCGIPALSLRANSKFTMDDVIEGVEYAHEKGKKVYLTLNLIAHNKDIQKLPEYIEVLKQIKPDGAIVADPAIFEIIKRELPDLNLHVSVQSNVTSWLGVKFWEKMGAKMCILSRELSFDEIREIRAKCPGIKLETFIHGSMCMSYSGRCLLSNYFTGRGANQGKCAHSCRWNYKVHLKLKDDINKEVLLDENSKDLFDFLLEEELRPNDLLQIEEWEGGAYILNSKDLCLLPSLPEFLKIGTDCLKIEGRNKTQYYVGMVTKTYRRAIDDFYGNSSWDYHDYLDDLYSISNRGFSLAFAKGKLTGTANNYKMTKSLSEYEFAGFVKSYGNDYINVEIKNRLDMGDELELITPTKNYKIVLNEFIISKTNNVVDFVSAGQEQTIKIPLEVFEDFGVKKEQVVSLFPVLTLIRKKNNTLTEEQKARIQQDKIDFEKENNFAFKGD
ncbi:MAG: U32 family peptidase C-terminal domain-containing protein [Rickettsiales bacterium]|jgi:putative protease|nr:U32 family peptidase C-terminal domain-containing protein [Rickettsiales bacterium]